MIISSHHYIIISSDVNIYEFVDIDNNIDVDIYIYVVSLNIYSCIYSCFALNFLVCL